jgi:hypothetical protein
MSMAKPFKPGGHKGKLHRELGIPEGEKIPKARLASAKRSSNPEVRRDAIRADTMEHWNHSRGHAHVRPRSHSESAYRRK